MTPNRVILIWWQYAKAGPLTPDLLSVTCGGRGLSARRGQKEREKEREGLHSVTPIMTR